MPTVPYRDLLLKRLVDPVQAAGYLTACLEEGDEVFLIGLRDCSPSEELGDKSAVS
jgi:hypothetical protein